MAKIEKLTLTAAIPCAVHQGSVGCRDGDCYAGVLKAIAVDSLLKSPNCQTAYYYVL